MNLKDRLYVATIGSDAVTMATQYGIGLEIDEFCTAENMDPEKFPSVNQVVREKMKSTKRHILHAPFNELFPAAINPMARRLALNRLEQAYCLTRDYGINRMVVHSGYVPFVYFKSWFSERSIEFWQEFISDKPNNFQIMIENVLEEEPYTLAKIIENIGDNRIRACLDTGHAYFTSNLEMGEWIESLGPWLSHMHIHNNDKEYDNHWPLNRGNMDFNRILEEASRYAPKEITFTIENLECEESLFWLKENGWLE